MNKPGSRTVRLPVDHINAELRRIGRSIDDAEMSFDGWHNDELMMKFVWPDGLFTRVSMGPAASDLAKLHIICQGRLH